MQLDVKFIISEVDWCHEPKPVEGVCVKITNIHQSTQQSTTRVGALMAQHPVWLSHHTGGSPSIPQHTRASKREVGSSAIAHKHHNTMSPNHTKVRTLHQARGKGKKEKEEGREKKGEETEGKKREGGKGGEKGEGEGRGEKRLGNGENWEKVQKR